MNPAEFQNIAAAEERMWWFRGMREIFRGIAARHLPASIGDVLDAGCGTGANAEWMARTFGWRVACLDFAEEGLLYAARRAGLAGFVRGDVRALPFRGRSFDLITIFDVLAHLDPGQEAEALREAERCLRPGGWLFLRASAFRWLRSRHSEFVNEKQRFTLPHLLETARRAGLRPRYSTYANSLLLPVAVAKFRLVEPLLRAPAASGVHLGPDWLENALGKVLELEARRIGRGGRFPIGQSAILLAQKEA
jgi:SAM-dependent methyltransferase